MDPLLVSAASPPGEIEVAPLRAAEAGAFAGMTFPIYRSLLDLEPAIVYPAEGDERRVRPVAFGARLDGSPAGLALAGAPEDDGAPPELFSIFVGRPHRRRGVGRALLQGLQDALRDAGHERLGGVYMTSLKGIEALEAFLADLGWHPPRARKQLKPSPSTVKYGGNAPAQQSPAGRKPRNDSRRRDPRSRWPRG